VRPLADAALIVATPMALPVRMKQVAVPVSAAIAEVKRGARA